ncbi:Asp23/Gls24 family envelope stress response protein [Garciella nitratireducens]|uniref:Uncharacterized conserved protein YloU, alkaline shock protein (Asp23) family n=1 Tax=Garciella nitratireducens DSM 15102 TaxID=1121911 RepID=A0A1T4K3Y6_9FIRM|nr:Asp23/Gls24 family envelope stress response protein [Garciella nitratireducens]RBP46659.1 putative alkaline shock family protein YloU [Garciella nitratireducens]SJZ37129.1 Uncharacterized conserved protein YloU, alkaline shock protein (Asp23) family [Garciella nitratireducens DSM 15102]
MEKKDIDKDQIEELKVDNLNIADDVINTIANIAASEIEGVSTLSSGITGGIVEMFGKKPSKGIKVETKEGEVKIDLSIIVHYGVRIPSVAWEVQENVKKSVEAMTGLKVTQVNIHVQGIKFENESSEGQKILEDEKTNN